MSLAITMDKTRIKKAVAFFYSHNFSFQERVWQAFGRLRGFREN